VVAVITIVSTSFRATTDADGELSLTGLPAGNHTLEIESPSQGRTLESVEITAGETAKRRGEPGGAINLVTKRPTVAPLTPRGPA
ncbi:MAG: carboxypeptidase regulatory-like domain-containing protein, partial [Holophagales bacterium]|nr:carboxypeptidase regulatory-like domain-containing protein [Holophagales bacterium]